MLRDAYASVTYLLCSLNLPNEPLGDVKPAAEALLEVVAVYSLSIKASHKYHEFYIVALSNL